MSRWTDWLPFRRKEKQRETDNAESDPSSDNPVLQLRDEVNNLFDAFFQNRQRHSGTNPLSERSFFGDFSPTQFSPSLDIEDEDKNIKVTAELPGLDASDIDLQLRDGNLLLKGQKQFEETDDSEGFYRTERAYGGFQRIIPMPKSVDPEGAEATFEQGILTVRIPKTDKALEGQRVEIST